MLQPSLLRGGWVRVLDGNDSAREIFERHYSRYRYADGRKPKLFVGPGEKMVLLRANADGIFAWRKFINDAGEDGVNCAIFRNESPDEVASELILEAEGHARERWPAERFYTYVDPREVKPTMVRGYPVWGFCFYKAGWKFSSVTKDGKHVLEKKAA